MYEFASVSAHTIVSNWQVWQARSETEELLGLDILVVSFSPFGECGQCTLHTLPHFLAFLLILAA